MDQLFPSSIAEDLEAVVHAGVVAATASEHVETWSGAVGAVDPAPTRSRAPGPKVSSLRPFGAARRAHHGYVQLWRSRLKMMPHVGHTRTCHTRSMPGSGIIMSWQKTQSFAAHVPRHACPTPPPHAVHTHVSNRSRTQQVEWHESGGGRTLDE